VVPSEEEVSLEEEEVLVLQPPLSQSRWKEGDALSWSMTMAPMMMALYHPWCVLCPSFFFSKT
jgi:hypothetical protein